MAGPDILLFIVGALLLSGAVVAIVMQGGTAALTGAGSPTSIFSVAYSTATADAAPAKAVADYSAAQKADFNVGAHNVTKLTFEAKCTDNVPAGAPAGAFQVTITVTPPTTYSGPAIKPVTAACGSAKVVVTLASVPPATNTQGASEAAAEAAIPQDSNATAAVGTWSVSTSGSRGGGTPLPGVPVGNPGGSITVSAETWKAKLTPVTK